MLAALAEKVCGSVDLQVALVYHANLVAFVFHVAVGFLGQFLYADPKSVSVDEVLKFCHVLTFRFFVFSLSVLYISL